MANLDRNNKSLSIGVGANTDKLQLKLRAIAKHAEELAKELDNIDSMIGCPKCGSFNVCKEYINCELTHASCNDCEYVIHDELPTRPEGSE